MKKLSKGIILAAMAGMVLTGCGTKSTDGVNLDKYMEGGQYEGVEIKTADVEQSLENAIQTALNNNVEYEQITKGKVKDGDTVNIDYVGTVDGKEFSGGSATDSNLKIGSGSFIPGFESGLVGAKIGKKVTLDLKFPDPYKNNEELSGKAVSFEVTVNYVQGDPLKLEFNDDFVKKNYPGYTTASEYEEYLRGLAVSDLAWKAVDGNMKVSKYPEEWIKDKIEQLFASYSQMVSQYGMKMEDYLTNMGTTEEKFKEETLKKEAEVYVKQKMISEYIGAKEDISVSDKEYKEQLQTYMTNSGYSSEEEFLKYYEDNFGFDMSVMIKENLLLGKVQEFISGHAKEVEGEATITPIPEVTEAPKATDAPADADKDAAEGGDSATDAPDVTDAPAE